jgi:peptide/nickel transport system permease protein
MFRYIFNRFLLAIPTLFGAAVITFFMLRVIPGDVVELRLAGDGGATVSQETIDAERARLGLDKPLLNQFTDWMIGAAQFDLGNSMWTGRSVVSEIQQRFGVTFQVALMSTAIAVLLAVPLGTVSALMRGTWVDYLARIFSMFGMSVPGFWVGLLILLWLLTAFRWQPPLISVNLFVDPLGNLSQLIWPALAVGYRFAAVLSRIVRSSVLEVLGEDYVRTARSKGLPPTLVIGRHTLRNAMLPAITIIGLEFAFLIGGLVVTEQVFNLNGLGKLFVQSVANRDFIMIQGMVMMFAAIYIVANLLVDILYAIFDPRIRYGTA